MIGTAKNLIHVEDIRNEICEECKEVNKLYTKVYSKIFILKVLPFVYGKEATVECYSCKKMYPDVNYLAHLTQDKVADIMGHAKHKWYGYIGYGLIGFVLLLGIFRHK